MTFFLVHHLLARWPYVALKGSTGILPVALWASTRLIDEACSLGGVRYHRANRTVYAKPTAGGDVLYFSRLRVFTG